MSFRNPSAAIPAVGRQFQGLVEVPIEMVFNFLLFRTHPFKICKKTVPRSVHTSTPAGSIRRPLPFVLSLTTSVPDYSSSRTASLMRQRSSEVTSRNFCCILDFPPKHSVLEVLPPHSLVVCIAPVPISSFSPRCTWTSNWSGPKRDTCANFPSGGLPAF